MFTYYIHDGEKAANLQKAEITHAVFFMNSTFDYIGNQFLKVYVYIVLCTDILFLRLIKLDNLEIWLINLSSNLVVKFPLDFIDRFTSI